MLLIALTVPNAHGQSRMTRQEYIDKYKETAMEAMRTHGIRQGQQSLRHQVPQRLEGPDLLQKG